MTIELSTPDESDLDHLVDVLAGWQHDGPVQLHPGDLGWYGRFGPSATAAALRVWRHHGEPVAIGLLDGPGLIRLAVAPAATDDNTVAATVVDDLTDTVVLPSGPATVEARFGAALRSRLQAAWPADEPWIPLRRSLSDPVPVPGLRIETINDDSDDRTADDWIEVVRSAFGQASGSRAELTRSPIHRERGSSLIGYDGENRPVAAVTVWSAGPGRPGILEPMGVHADHRGRGYGRAICSAAAAALRTMGSSTATVATPDSNDGAVATYVSAGYRALPAVTDFRRPD